MSLALLVSVAIVLPVVLVVALIYFARGATWFAARPRMLAVAMMAFGPLYGAFGLWQGRSGLDEGSVLFLVGGALFFAGGLYQWFRGQAVDLE